MSVAIATEPQILHALPGRLRVRLPAGLTSHPGDAEARLSTLPGISSVRVSDVTNNALVVFDPNITSERDILRSLAGQWSGDGAQPGNAALTSGGDAGNRSAVKVTPMPARDGAAATPGARKMRARVAVPGIDRDPHLARRVVEHVKRQPGVRRAVANPLTGRVLVEFTEHETDIDDLVAQISNMELPDIPDEDNPTHPLDPAPLVQGSALTTSAVIGFGVMAAKRLTNTQDLLVSQEIAGQTANIFGILRGFPPIRNGSRRLFGPNAADILLTLPNLVALALSENPLGLAVTGLESLRLLTEVILRRRAFKQYERRLETLSDAQPGTMVRVETGDRTSLAGRVIEGNGTAMGRDGLPEPVSPGGHVPAGAKLYGGPFVLELESGKPFTPAERPAPLTPTIYDRYARGAGLLSLAYAALTGVFTRSVSRMLQALVLVSPRTAVIGMEAANLHASARTLRAGVVVAGTRPDRTIRLPNTVLFDGARLLTDGYEVTSILPLSDAADTTDLLIRAAAVAQASGSPWGGAFRASGGEVGSGGSFDGTTASATVGSERYTLTTVTDWDEMPAAARLQQRGNHPLLLRGERQGKLGIFVLRPRITRGASELVDLCRRYNVEVGLIADGDSLAAREVSRRTGVPVVAEDALDAIRSRQARGDYVVFVADSADAAEAFAACDLGIGVVEPRGQMPARADLIAPDLAGVASVVESGARRHLAVRDSVLFSALSNGIGVAVGTRGVVAIDAVTQGVYGTAMAALADGWWRMHGGERPRSALEDIAEPRPERWGRLSIEDALRQLHASRDGLTTEQALQRLRKEAPKQRRSVLLPALLEQLKSPLTLILGGGAAVTLFLGAPGDAALIAATIAANALVAAWQERRVGKAAEALERMGTVSARVLRDGEVRTLPASDIVQGDVLVLSSGDTVAGDARVLEAQNLEVDEAPLTGESLPVAKSADGGSDYSRIVLEGTDVTTGSGYAVVVAVGRQTRMGATAAALAAGEMQQSPLGVRLGAMVRQSLPLSAAAGLIVSISGALRGGALLSQLAFGGTIALAALPEGLPVLAQVGEAGVARRLATRNALVRRLSAVEALGRVDVACTDKTGTLTEGRLALRLVAGPEREATLPGSIPEDLRPILLAAALASPHPDDPGASSHPTDVAVVRGAQEAGLNGLLYEQREAEVPFDPVRSYAAAVVGGRLYVKGAPEELISRCGSLRTDGDAHALDEQRRDQLLEQAHALAGRGLRILLTAEGSPESPIDDPRDLTALGFIGISDPLRPTAHAAVRKCREAGIRVIMLTGDHPATARAIAHEAGLLDGGHEVLTGGEIAELHNGELDAWLERAAVIARATPLDKVRIIESLQRHSHTIAMTGDGVNDAPALRLADVGVAMGRGGTEVARQTADVVLVDDDFSTLVDALVEGRSYWSNVRRALGLLVGGNLGELGLIVGASLLGLAAPLSARQVLGVNIITDVLPGLAVALQQPENHNLAELAREGEASLGVPLRNDILRRAGTTAGPSLAATLLAFATGGLGQASTVAFTSIVSTQLAQTVDASRTDEGWNIPMLAAVASSAGILASALAVPQLRAFLGLAMPSPFGWALVAAATGTALALNRFFAPNATVRLSLPRLLALPAPAGVPVLPA